MTNYEVIARLAIGVYLFGIIFFIYRLAKPTFLLFQLPFGTLAKVLAFGMYIVTCLFWPISIFLAIGVKPSTIDIHELMDKLMEDMDKEDKDSISKHLNDGNDNE